MTSSWKQETEARRRRAATADGADIAEARRLLEANGWKVLREKSYRQAVERQRVADALRQAAEERLADYERWVREDLAPRERDAINRLLFVYGVARAHGISVEELSGREHIDAGPGA